MTITVKICGMSDARAVSAAVDAGADAIGFVFFARSPRNVTPEQATALAANIPAHVQRIAVMLHPTQAYWQDVARRFKPDVLQTDADDFAYLDVPAGISKWPVFREGGVTPETTLSETYLYEGRKSGAGSQVDWKVAAEFARQGRMILAGGLDADNVAQAIAMVAPWGVDVSSAVESHPGVKDAAKIAAFVEAARTAEKLL